MPRKTLVRKVKFTPEEMALDVPKDTSHLKFKRKYRPTLVELDSEVAKFFKDATAVNKVLRMFMEAVPTTAKKRKTA